MKKLKSLLPSKSNHKPTTTTQASPPSTHDLPPNKPKSACFLLIGGGSRGAALANAINTATNGVLVSIADPDPGRRLDIGRRYVWGKDNSKKEGQEFAGWREFIEWESARRRRESVSKDGGGDDNGAALSQNQVETEMTEPKSDIVTIDAVIIATPDRTHLEIVAALAPLGLHIMCEKPLATSLTDCLEISRSLGANLRGGEESGHPSLFGIGHVMRYTPINQLVHRLIYEEDAIGDIVAVEHTENVGWWHFAHSYVRGNWRNQATSGPTLLTKSCHDIDFLMWLLCSPTNPDGKQRKPHTPSTVASFGALTHFKRARKPLAAGTATNCLSCPAEDTCHFSAKKIYLDTGLRMGLGGWPVNVVVPEIEDLFDEGGMKRGEEVLLQRLGEDHTADTPKDVREGRQWYGRCVYESDNNVCDDQTVHIAWEDDTVTLEGGESVTRPAKSATFHMTAFADGVCTKRTRILGTKGEIERRGGVLAVCDFRTGQFYEKKPGPSFGGHGGGDYGLMRAFVDGVDAVRNRGMGVHEAQEKFIGCTVEDIVRSHAMVFAAEEARTSNRIVDWGEWWKRNVLEFDTVGTFLEENSGIHIPVK
ncbi:NAD(P)-binding protein [Aspergillus pseudoustus]|uniref:NAD(P)-binding protein n=1 Tax=Aspergillus pseudoustus TaxID=1810923 RepID=A0ABR4JN03_9EURO